MSSFVITMIVVLIFHNSDLIC